MVSQLWLLLASVAILLRILKARPLASRDVILPPSEERVVLLGASSGVGRDLSHAYAKRGARICIVARRTSSLDAVRKECLALGIGEERIILVNADVTSTSELINVRDRVIETWGGFDTLHILVGVPSTTTLLDLAGVPLVSTSSERRRFSVDGEDLGDLVSKDNAKGGMPNQQGMDRVAAEARACAEINYVGTVLALACFLPLLASTSTSPALHHLSSVAATVPGPRRNIYSATKSAALSAVETSLLPGTIANDFRTKTPFAQTGGDDEQSWGKELAYDHLTLAPAQGKVSVEILP
ncbi:MAG: hypothetical protein TREMPRED_000782 [Tremellales sp. Tagirdzhanova-0007]|nr:MAG: hypothetical protein TREMPRED_000782 [Tremellales sp. Tagirdzhanova-0007]